MLRQYLDGNGAVQAGVAGLADLAHPALTDESGHFVRAEAGTRG